MFEPFKFFSLDRQRLPQTNGVGHSGGSGRSARRGCRVRAGRAAWRRTPDQARKIRVGVIGCGNVSVAYCRSGRARRHRLVSICDIIFERAQAAAKRFKVPHRLSAHRQDAGRLRR